MRQEVREAERKKKDHEREAERWRAREEEDRLIREEERLRVLRSEKEEFAIRDAERQSFAHKPKFMKIREMRENEDIDDYFRIFELTQKYNRYQKVNQPRSQGPLSTSRKYPGYGWSRVYHVTSRNQGTFSR